MWNFVCIIAAIFRLTLSSCGCVNKGIFYNKTSFVLRTVFLIWTVWNTKWCRLTEILKSFYWFKAWKTKEVKLNITAVLTILLIYWNHKQIYGLSGFSSYVGIRYCFYLPSAEVLNVICYIDLFKCLFIWAWRKCSRRWLLFSKWLLVLSIIQVTLSLPTIFDLNCSLKIEFNFAFFHSFQKHCTPC